MMSWGIAVHARGPYLEHYFVHEPSTNAWHPVCHPSSKRHRRRRILRGGTSPRGRCPTCVARAGGAA